MEATALGAKVRSIRKEHRITQARLAEQLGISASYLNLIEHNRRPLPAGLLLKVARLFDLDLDAFIADDTAQVHADLMEVFGDEIFDEAGLTRADVDEVVEHHPNVARAVRTLYDALISSRRQAQDLAADSDGQAGVGHRSPSSEEVGDFFQVRGNYFDVLEAAAEGLSARARLDPHRMQEGLVSLLEGELGYDVRFVSAAASEGRVRRIDRAAKVIEVSELLRPRSRNFQLAHTLGLLTQSDVLDDLVDDPLLSREESRRLARVALCNYFAAAVLMPYEPFLKAVKDNRYDIELVGHRFRVSFEQVCHRLTTLRRPGREGVPFHLIRIDIAGNISKRFSASGIRFARYSGACPRWNVFRALLTPGQIRTQVSEMPDGTTFFCLARTLDKGDRGWRAFHTVHAIGLGCQVEHASELVYADGVDLSDQSRHVEIGVSCRACPRKACEQRAMPSVGSPLRIDEDVRGVAFYSDVE